MTQTTAWKTRESKIKGDAPVFILRQLVVPWLELPVTVNTSDMGILDAAPLESDQRFKEGVLES